MCFIQFFGVQSHQSCAPKPSVDLLNLISSLYMCAQEHLKGTWCSELHAQFGSVALISASISSPQTSTKPGFILCLSVPWDSHLFRKIYQLSLWLSKYQKMDIVSSYAGWEINLSGMKLILCFKNYRLDCCTPLADALRPSCKLKLQRSKSTGLQTKIRFSIKFCRNPV